MHVFRTQNRCMDFSTNPYATVLIPEPMDYFAACGATSMCEAKCNAEFTAFDRQLAMEQALHSMAPTTRTIERTTESMLFVDLDEDAYMPMNIVAMVELSDCRWGNAKCILTSRIAAASLTSVATTCEQAYLWRNIFT